MVRALEGVRVIELGQYFAAPVACTLLAEFGAEVIKVEPLDGGDRLRRVGHTVGGVGLQWCVEGRNKKSVTLNVRHPRGRDLLKRLIRASDALIENARPGFMEEIGLDEKVVLEANPKLIFARVSGFGKTGPLSGKTAYDSVALGYAGLQYITGYRDRPPVRIGNPVGDYTAALFTAVGVLIALYHRDAHKGDGQVVDVALYESVFRLMGNLVTLYDQKGIIREREGNRSMGSAFTGIFKTGDNRYFTLNVLTDADFARFSRALGRDDWLQEVMARDAQGRPADLKVMEDCVRRWASRRTLDQVLKVLDEWKIPSGPVYSAADIVEDIQYMSRGMVPEMEMPGVGSMKVIGVVPRLAETPGRIETPPPSLGANNDEVYCGLLALSRDELSLLKKDGIV